MVLDRIIGWGTSFVTSNRRKLGAWVTKPDGRAAKVRQVAANGLIFFPGVFFVLMAAAAFVVPHLLVALAASFFLFFGFLLCFGGYKLLQLKRKFAAFTQKFDAHILIHPQMGEDSAHDDEQLSNVSYQENGKKIILH